MSSPDICCPGCNESVLIEWDSVLRCWVFSCARALGAPRRLWMQVKIMEYGDESRNHRYQLIDDLVKCIRLRPFVKSQYHS
jgi:hypothetical protein